ncbi:hemicentin-1 isoform X3 [Sphaeramia orbicularis]|uniref:Hemicentin-1-like n=1 Tax=Sphaeramia orbicularis TaxID=375764 RepID=A0A673BGB4_9TELE|nr:hemicentin-1-like isoform X3 [Sphaeramia orbicularis]
MTQLGSTTSTCGAQWKMWLIKVFSVIYVSAVCAAQDPQDVTAFPDVFKTEGVPIQTAAPTVYKPPVPSVQRFPPWSEVFPSEKVTFSCDVIDSSDWTIIWKVNYERLSKTDPHLSFSPNGSVLTITAMSEDQSGNYSCVGQHKVKKVFTEESDFLELMVDENKPKPTVTSSFTSEKMFTGESVTFTCAVSVSSGWEYTWFHNGQEVQASDTYTIPSVGPANSGQYHCQAKRGSPPVHTAQSDRITLDVSEIPVPSLTNLTSWLDVFPTESVRLGCGMETGSSDWTYTWYKDGQMVQAGNTVSLDTDRAVLSISSASASHAGRYQCTGRRKDRAVTSSESTGLTLTVYGTKPRVELVQDPEYTVMFPGERVSFRCHIDVSTGWEFVWYKDNTDLGSTENMYSVDSVSTTDSGSYTCKAKRGQGPVFSTDPSQTKHIEVKSTKPIVELVQDPEYTVMFPGEHVSFRCHINVSTGWEFVWYKDNMDLGSTENMHSVDSVSTTDSGSYACKAKRGQGSVFSTDPSQTRHVDVKKDKPKPVMTQVPNFDKVYTGESLTFICTVDISSGWEYLWYKDGTELPTTGRNLTINDAKSSDSGVYKCKARRSKTMFNTEESEPKDLNISEIPVPSLTNLTSWLDVFTDETVRLGCGMEAGSSDWTYTWYKDGHMIQAGNTVSLDTDGAALSISSASGSHVGHYQCTGKRKDRTVTSSRSTGLTLTVSERPSASIILLTGWSEVFSTENLVLKCVVDSQDQWNYTWFKQDVEISPPSSERHSVTPQNDPDQSLYVCQGIRDGRPNYSKKSDSFKTSNLLLKRRVLLSISGCLFFGLVAVFIGCIVLRVTRKPAEDLEKQEETNLFLTMAELKERGDAPCPLVEYITDADMKDLSKEPEENGTICSESTPLPTVDEAGPSESNDTTESNGGMVSFKQ